MGNEHSKSRTSESKMETEDVEEDDDESEILEIMVEEECCEEEGAKNLGEKYCKKRDVHENYIPIKALNLQHVVPESIRHESLLHYIQLRAQLVVKIMVHYTSAARPPGDKFYEFRGKNNTRTASGYAWIHCQEQEPVICQNELCSENQEKPHNVYLGILVTTNRHVIFNNEEAVEAEVMFFYDDDDEAEVVKGHGTILREELDQKDYVSLKIYHHCESLFQKVNDINEQIIKTWENIPHDIKLELEKHAIVISHPHGLPKIVTVGDILEMEMLEKDKKNKSRHRKLTTYSCTTCSGSSGAPVITGLYWTNPFVHSSQYKYIKKSKKSEAMSIGMSLSY